MANSKSLIPYQAQHTQGGGEHLLCGLVLSH